MYTSYLSCFVTPYSMVHLIDILFILKFEVLFLFSINTYLNSLNKISDHLTAKHALSIYLTCILGLTHRHINGVSYSGTCLKRPPMGPKLLLTALDRWSCYAGSTECKRVIQVATRIGPLYSSATAPHSQSGIPLPGIRVINNPTPKLVLEESVGVMKPPSTEHQHMM